jgi:histidinol dehydrogenase
VARIVDAVRREGDRALLRFTARYDGVVLAPGGVRMPPAEVRALARRAPPEVVAALRDMAARIESYHGRQRETGFVVRSPDGSHLEELVRPLPSAGLYVPGGAGAYPSSVLMNAIPARVAGVPRLAVATPPRALEGNPAVAAALVLAGLEGEVYRVGGAQGVAALAYGTQSVPAVAKIVGPGNAYVTAAKRLVRAVVEVDQDAGPSEVVVLADGSADAALVAGELLAQAEHGSGEEAVVLVTSSRRLATSVARLVQARVGAVANPRSARRALAARGAVVAVRDLAAGLAAVNALAPEHALVWTRAGLALARRVVAGAVFVGAWSPVAAGDYGIGPNHVLPTGGTARARSPLSVQDFQRRQSLVRLSARGLRAVAEGMARVADAEGFRAHAASLRARGRRPRGGTALSAGGGR